VFPLAGAEPAPEPLPSAPAPPPVIPLIRWERRRLTVLRAALRAPAPEGDWAVESSRALDVLVEKLASFGGIVLEVSPSGLVGACGVTPMEDAPSRAALAALAIVKAVSRSQPVGAAPTLMVAVALHVEQFMLARVGAGTTLDEAAKRQAWAVLDDMVERAEADTILASGASVAFLHRRFELFPAESDRPVYRLGRFEPTGIRPGDRLATFVGRQPDLQLLRSRLDAVMRGQGQVVDIAGDAGIGKSRLLFEFRQSLAGQQVTYLEGNCFSYTSTVPYVPVIDLGLDSLGLSD